MSLSQDLAAADRPAAAPPIPEVILAGDSHMFSLGVPNACAEDPATLLTVTEGAVRFVSPADPWRGSRGWGYWQAVAAQVEGRFLAIGWNGNQHQAGFLIARGRPFDFVCPGAGTETIDPNAELVPLSVIRAFFRPSLTGLHKVAALATKAQRVLVLGTPAPKRDDDFVLAQVRRSDFFVQRARDAGLDPASMRLTPPAVRQKLWTVLQQEMATAAEQAGALFIPCPAETLEPDGTLVRDCWAQDATHANARWGDAMRRCIERAVQAES
ncbi:hypothetical protein [Falsiroseomonas sp. HW251]|uniref:hypothetical protein n=1 Tax=Falsiroseomonas sp. HW251 TaxID=3390998 RepID=UPI003D312EBC